jgi:hypothetical protein
MAILKPSAFHIGREVALDALSCTYIYARIPQIAEIRTSFYATRHNSGDRDDEGGSQGGSELQ